MEHDLATLWDATAFRRLVATSPKPGTAFETALNALWGKYGPDGTLLRASRDGTTPLQALCQLVLPVTDTSNPVEAYLFCNGVRSLETSRDAPRGGRIDRYFKGTPGQAFAELASRADLQGTVLGQMVNFANRLPDGRYQNVFVNTPR